MAEPKTTGKLCNNVSEMDIGDYIKLGYTNSKDIVKSGHFFDWGYSGEANELPAKGLTSVIDEGYFYFVKVAKGLLVADRTVKRDHNWDSLNKDKYIQGRKETDSLAPGSVPSGMGGIFRSISGGICVADKDGNKSSTFNNAAYTIKTGLWPINNELTRFVLNFPKELIKEGHTINDVFCIKSSDGTTNFNWTQETPTDVGRDKRLHFYVRNEYLSVGSASSSAFGAPSFYPVFAYKEL